MPASANTSSHEHSLEDADRTHVALFMPSLDGGGAERVMVTVASALAKRGHDVDLVLVNKKGDYGHLVHDDIRIIDLAARRILGAVPGLIRYLRDERPDAMLSTLFFTNVIATWACRWVQPAPRLILREANTISAKSAEASNPKFRLMPYLARWFYPWADAVVTVSNAAGEDLVQITEISPEKVQTIYNPVVTDDLKEKAAEPVEHPWFQPEAPPVILGAGRLERQKDFETLIRAFRHVRTDRPARLIILGRGSLKEQLQGLAQSLGVGDDVLLPGFVNNPFTYMARSSVFVLSSRFEGLPGVLIQAMATGCPVVSTDCPSGPREILIDGEVGPLVPVGDVEGLARGILETLDDPPDSRFLKDEAERFSDTAAVEAYTQVLTGQAITS
jgi:glycosyltransferase involved in cell wall biosynthesis